MKTEEELSPLASCITGGNKGCVKGTNSALREIKTIERTTNLKI